MRLVLQLSGREGQPADQWSVEGHGLSIGRGPDNDWVLPDPQRHLSKQHCNIDFRGGQYFLTDTSTNGVFINYSPQRIPQGASQPLNDGDIIQLGSYEIVASLEAPGLPQGSADDPFGDLPAPYEEAPVIAPRQQVQARDSFDSPDAFVSGLDRPDTSLTDDPDPFFDGDDPFARGGPSAAQAAQDPFADPLGSLGSDSPGGGQLSRGVRALIPDDDDLIGPGLDDDPQPTDEWEGITPSNHNAASQDFFSPPEVAGQSLPEDWSTIPDDFNDLTGPSATPSPPASAAPAPRPQATAPIPAPAAPQPVPQVPQAPQAPQAQPAAPPAALPSDLSLGRVFLEAAGVPTLDVKDEDLPALMQKVGRTYRLMAEGLRELLMTRSSLKSEFRMDQTMIGARENNPLKFSATGEEALKVLLMEALPGYMKGEKAIEEGFKDVASHQLAMMAGMQHALTSLLKRFDPEVLTKRIEGHSSLRDIVPGGKKARYWEVFMELHGQIAEEAEEDFQALFGKEFSKAYQAQSKKED